MLFTYMNPSVRSAARVLDLLEFLAGSERGVSLTAAASSLRLPKSSTLMLLRTLVERGYVRRNEEDHYVLNESFRTRGFGWGGSRFARLIAASRPVMERLCEKVGETVILGVLDEDGRVRLLAKAVAAQDIRYDVDITTRLPAFCTAMGRVLLGSLPRERQTAILEASERTKLTPETATELGRLHRLIDQAGRLGYAIVEEEFSLGGTGVAAPVLDRDGRVIATLNVACVTRRFQSKRKIVISTLLEEVVNLSGLFLQPPGSRMASAVRDQASAV